MNTPERNPMTTQERVELKPLNEAQTIMVQEFWRMQPKTDAKRIVVTFSELLTFAEAVSNIVTRPPVEGEVEGCSVCGAQMASIRGKYPHTDNRTICPTCAYERLEQISEILNSNRLGQSHPAHHRARRTSHE